MSGIAWTLAVVLLLTLVVWAQRRIPLLPYLYFWRFPLLLAIVLVGFAPFSLRVAPSLLRNLFVLSHREILLVSWLATLTAWVVMVTGEVILRYAPLRFAVAPFPLPLWFRRHRLPLFALLAWPLIGTAAALSPPPLGRNLAMAAGGILLAALGLLAAAVFRALFRDRSHPPAGILLPWRPRWLDALPRLRPSPAQPPSAAGAETPGPDHGDDHGYKDRASNTVRAGHLLAAFFFAVTACLYGLGFFLLRPDRGSMPALGYVMLILMLVGWALPGISFFLDRYRVPVLLPLMALSYLSSQVFETDHFYRLALPPVVAAGPGAVKAAPVPLPSEAFQAAERQNPELQHPVVVVAASGGGNTASLWTAVALTSLQREIGVDFTRSIRLISAVSGGSVGTMYFLDRFTPEGPPTPQALEEIVAAAKQPSLDAAAWGLAYPDLWRVFCGFCLRTGTIDRGWALEQAWRRRLRHPDAMLSGWGQGTAAGWLPAAVLNATASETGEPFLLTPLDWPARWKGLFFSSAYPNRDLPVTTAARLSATFPYVAPLARAQDVDGRPASPGFHLADGGYYDNFGVVTVVSWLRSLSPDQLQQLKERRLLLVLLRAFPQGPGAAPGARQRNAWLYATAGPLLTVYHVRTSSQSAVGNVEVELIQSVLRSYGIESLQVIFQLERASPLSWKLTREEQERIIAGWNDDDRNRRSLAAAKGFFQAR